MSLCEHWSHQTSNLFLAIAFWYFVQNTTRKSNSSLPVMVYIHEGGFFAGTIHTSLRGPQYFMDAQQVILVLMTYRLGVFGESRMPVAQITGNAELDETARTGDMRIVRSISSFGFGMNLPKKINSTNFHRWQDFSEAWSSMWVILIETFICRILVNRRRSIARKLRVERSNTCAEMDSREHRCLWRWSKICHNFRCFSWRRIRAHAHDESVVDR